MDQNKLQDKAQSDKTTLQPKNKEKQETAAEGIKTRCKICFKETSPNSKCGGHGGGGSKPSGGGWSGNTASGSSAEKGISMTAKGSSTDTSHALSNEILDARDEISEDSKLPPDEKLFNPEIIAELLSKNLLDIDNDREIETLTIKLRCKPNELSEAQKNTFTKFVNAIVKELNDFKDENGISANCKLIELDGGGNLECLRIALPNLKQYDAFIQQLASNLLPEPKLNVDQHARPGSQKPTQPLNFTPLLTKPTPDVIKSLESRTHEGKDSSEKPFNPSPFSTTPMPKPKG